MATINQAYDWIEEKYGALASHSWNEGTTSFGYDHVELDREVRAAFGLSEGDRFDADEESPKDFEDRTGWKAECMDNHVVVVWGHGPSAIRRADSSAPYVSCAASEEYFEADGPDDRWVVTLDPRDASPDELDRDPAVAGYQCIEI